MNGMEGKEISQKELEKDGWKFTGTTFGFTHKLFKKGDKRILWDSRAQKVGSEWSEKKK